ncbi:MAG: beta-propeller fold lactonase family protein [Candidatus Poribacteria bacterium]|nr:beta-propeller fold lactonase family protein [Candidatus Poribacteria bacterium]
MKSKQWRFLSVFICCLATLFIACGDDDDDDNNDTGGLSIPTIPAGMTAQSEADGVALTWQKSENTARYNIYRSTQQNAGFENPIGTSDSTNFKDTTAEPDKIYFYKVAGVSPKSEGVEIVGDRSPPLQWTHVVADLTVETQVIDFGESNMTQPLKITNSGGAPLDWEIKADVNWLTFDPAKGMLAGKAEQVITLTAIRNGQPGEFKGTITITAKQDQPITIAVKMAIPQEPMLSAEPDTVDFGFERAPKQIQVGNTGTGTLDWEAEKEKKVPWLRISPLSGTVSAGQQQPLTLELVSSELGRLQAGQQFSETILVTGADKTNSVTVTVETEKPTLDVSPTTIDMGADLERETLTIRNVGTGTMTWNVTDGDDWLTVEPTSGTTRAQTTDQVTLTVDRQELSEGLHSTTIRVNAGEAGDEEVTINIQVTVPPQLSVSTQTFDFGKTTTTQVLEIRNSGEGQMEWDITGGDAWLMINPREGTTQTQPDPVQLTVDREGLAPGTHTTSIVVEADAAGNETITVTVSGLNPPVLTLSQNAIDFGDAQTLEDIQIVNTGESTLEWDAGISPNWVIVSPANGVTEAGFATDVTIEVDRSMLDAGQYSETIRFSGNGGTVDLAISLTRLVRITGTVLDVRTNRPIADATVNVSAQESRTQFDGMFELRFEGTDGEYTLTAEGVGYIRRERSVETQFGQGELEVLLSPIARKTGEIDDERRLVGSKRIAYAGNRAYVTNERNNSVTVINTAADSVIDDISLNCNTFGCKPIGLAANPLRSEVYVASADSDQINIINTDTNRDVRQLSVGDHPVGCAVSHDGSRLYVTNQRDNTVTVINLDTQAAAGLIDVGRDPAGIVISPDDAFLYVSNNSGDNVSVVDLVFGAEITKIPVGNSPDAIAIAENGEYVYVVNTGSGDLSIIDTSTQTTIRREVTPFPVGVAALREVDGREIAYVVDFDGTIAAVEMPSRTVIPDIGVRGGAFVEAIGYDPSARKLYVLDSAGGKIVVLE